MTDDLAAAIERARRALADRTDGHLPRPERAAVLDELGPDAPDDPASYPRLVAEASVVERSLIVWSAERPEDKRPALLVSAALSSPQTVRTAIERISELQEAIADALNERAISDEAGAAGTASIALIETAAYGFGGEAGPGVDDDELDPDVWAAEYHGEMALTGVDPTFRVDERRALWAWWLDEAVPAASQAGLRPE